VKEQFYRLPCSNLSLGPASISVILIASL